MIDRSIDRSIDRKKYTDIYLLSVLFFRRTQTNTVGIQKGVLRKPIKQTTQPVDVECACLVLPAEAGEIEVKTSSCHIMILQEK